MRRNFAFRLAWREARSGARRVGLYTGAIALGVAALVAINSFRASVVASIHEEARTLLGADLRLHSGSAFPEAVLATLDSVEAAGASVSRVTRLGSMALALPSGRTRLLQVHAVSGGYPFYGEVRTEPAGLWPLTDDDRRALVDPAVLVQLEAAVGDTLAIGHARFIIAGTVEGVGGDVGLQSAIGPSVYIPAAFLESTGLVQFGSLVRHQVYLHFGDDADVRRFVAAHETTLREQRVGLTAVEERANDLTEAAGSLGRFLGLVGLMAVLLGGIGVASAVHAYVRDKLPGIAVLRCLGATRRDVFGAYLLQTVLLGLGGAAVGVVLGLAVQALLPSIVGELVPVEVRYRIHLPAVLGGLAVGGWTATVFALLPLLAVRDVAPLQALRRDVEPERKRFDPWRVCAFAALGASVVVLGVSQAPSVASGIVFAIATGVVLGLLSLAASGLAWSARRFLPARADYAVRQGVANLFRPRNHTAAVTLSIGFGVLLLATLHLVKANLLERLRVDAEAGRPNLLLFDIQRDQVDGIAAVAGEHGVRLESLTPLVPARIAAVNGRAAAELLADPSDGAPDAWTLRREYRNTYRATLSETETLMAGEWWDTRETGERPAERSPRISLEEEIARELGVGLGDRITWDVQGVPIETEVASIRRVDWARFAPNFFVVFEPGVLDEAPQTLIALARVPDATARAELQRALVERYPNLSALDLAAVQEAVDDVVGKASLAIRFLALFAIAGGLVVLVGALTTTRFQRMREVALLRTLGASRAQIRRILLTEYLALGAVAGLAGAGLAGVTGWGLVTRLFELDFRLPALALVGTSAATAIATAFVGYLNSRDLIGHPPLEVLREVEG